MKKKHGKGSRSSKRNQKSSASLDKINKNMGEVSPLSTEVSMCAISSASEQAVPLAPLGSDE